MTDLSDKRLAEIEAHANSYPVTPRDKQTLALCRALREERGWKAQWETANRVIAIRDAELREEREAHEATRALLREVGKTLEEEFAARKEAVRIVRALAEIPVRPGEVLKHEGLAVAVADLLYRFPEGGP